MANAFELQPKVTIIHVPLSLEPVIHSFFYRQRETWVQYTIVASRSVPLHMSSYTSLHPACHWLISALVSHSSFSFDIVVSRDSYTHILQVKLEVNVHFVCCTCRSKHYGKEFANSDSGFSLCANYCSSGKYS